MAKKGRGQTNRQTDKIMTIRQENKQTERRADRRKVCGITKKNNFSIQEDNL